MSARAPFSGPLQVEENAAAFLLALGRAGGGEERDDDRIHWTIGGSPIAYHNCVVGASLEPDDADAAIVASQERMRFHGVRGSWHVGPSMRPDDLAERLVAHGFDGGPEPGMAASLEDVPRVQRPAGLSIERVTDETGLDAFAGVLSAGFGEGPTEATWVRRVYGTIGLDDEVPWRHYIGRLEGVVVATASLFSAAHVAGIYFVCTHPDFRRRGIGTAITRDAMLAARVRGYDTAVLGSSPMGHGVYERLGFADVCKVGVYEWGPE